MTPSSNVRPDPYRELRATARASGSEEDAAVPSAPGFPWFTCCVMLPAGAVVLLVLLLFQRSILGVLAQRSFDSEDWLADTGPFDERDISQRMLMAEDLVESRRLLGLSRGALVECLGPPDWERTPESEGRTRLIYDLGWELTPFPLDGQTLQVSLDPHGVVDEEWIEHD